MSCHDNGRASPHPAETVLDRLTRAGCDPRPCGAGKWESQCPAHQGTRHNLSIAKTSDGTVLLRCHHVDDAGQSCSAEEIVGKLGLEMCDLFRPVAGSHRSSNGKPKTTNGKPKKAGPHGFKTPREAAEFLARRLNVARESGHWVYEHDDVVYAGVYRFDLADGKSYRPVSLDPTTGLWLIKDPPRWLPYRLAEIKDAIRVYFVEGEKNVELIRSLGLAATTTAHGAEAPHKTDLAILAGKQVVIVPDHDAPGEGYRKKVQEQLAQLDPQPRVRVLRLPGLVNDGDDIEQWIEARDGATPDELRAEIEQLADALPIEELSGPGHESPAGKGPGKPIPLKAGDDPHRLARLFLKDHFSHPDGATLVYHREEFYRWDDSVYRAYRDVQHDLVGTIEDEFSRLNVIAIEIATREAMSGAMAAAKDKGKKKSGDDEDGLPTARKVTSGVVRDTMQALRSEACLSWDEEAPCWIGEGDEARPPAIEMLPAGNGIVDLGTLKVLPKTPAFFSPFTLDYDVILDAPRPVRWFRFLGELWPNDPECIRELGKIFGYLLTPNTSMQKIFFLKGPPRSGKGTIIRILTRMLGGHNVINPTFASMATNFGLASFVGKSAAIITDARVGGSTSERSQVIERLLNISGEDGITIERKYKDSITTKLPTRLIISTNVIPNLRDESGALVSRIIPLKMTVSFLGREDFNLTEKLYEELPGILRWFAIEGRQWLREDGRFHIPRSCLDVMDDLRGMTSPVMRFVDECCTLIEGHEDDPQDLTPIRDFFHAFDEWCRNTKHESGSEGVFSQKLVSAYPFITSERPRSEINPKRPRCYRGIKLNKQGEAMRLTAQIRINRP